MERAPTLALVRQLFLNEVNTHHHYNSQRKRLWLVLLGEPSPSILIAVSVTRATHSTSILTSSVSPYSWFGFTNIKNYRSQLQSHGVEVCIEPFFLGGARNGVGNPWTPPLEAKSAFMQQDLDLTSKLLGLRVVRPKVFPISSLSVSILETRYRYN
jgi:hypothetical protein